MGILLNLYRKYIKRDLCCFSDDFSTCYSDKLAGCNYCFNHVFDGYTTHKRKNSICIVRNCKNSGSTNYTHTHIYPSTENCHTTDLCEEHYHIYYNSGLYLYFQHAIWGNTSKHARLYFILILTTLHSNINRYHTKDFNK